MRCSGTPTKPTKAISELKKTAGLTHKANPQSIMRVSIAISGQRISVQECRDGQPISTVCTATVGAVTIPGANSMFMMKKMTAPTALTQ